jgi:periplasmic protein TonB
MSNGPSPRSLSRIEVAVLLGISITGHTALAYKVSRARAAEPQVVAQSVSIEMEPPQVEPPKKVSPPPPEHEPPRTRPLVAARRPSVRPQFDPPAPVEQPPATDEPEPLAPAPAPPAAPTGPPGPPATAPIAPIARPAPVIAAHEGANYLKNPRPAYPELALRREWQGEVLLRVQVSPEGRAIGISVERSSGRDVLDQAAQEAVRGWSFVPSRQGGIAIAGWVTVPIVFRLQQGE